MTWVIAILLGLILVAMVSSNQAAAAGVWTVVRFVLWGLAALVGWAVLIGYSVWFYETYHPDSEWTRIIGVTCAVLIPPTLLWFSRKQIAVAYKGDKWAAIKFGTLFVICIFGYMVVGVVVREVLAAYEYGGWTMILAPLALTFVILLWRTVAGPKPWREIWFGPPAAPEPWLVVANEQEALEATLLAEREKIDETWDELTQTQKDDWLNEHRAKVDATEIRLTEMRKNLAAEKKDRDWRQVWTVQNFFTLFLIFAVFGLLGILWDIGIAYAMELKFVKGQVWLARTVVVVAAMVIGGMFVSLFESVSDTKAKNA